MTNSVPDCVPPNTLRPVSCATPASTFLMMSCLDGVGVGVATSCPVVSFDPPQAATVTARAALTTTPKVLRFPRIGGGPPRGRNGKTRTFAVRPFTAVSPSCRPTDSRAKGRSPRLAAHPMKDRHARLRAMPVRQPARPRLLRGVRLLRALGADGRAAGRAGTDAHAAATGRTRRRAGAAAEAP